MLNCIAESAKSREISLEQPEVFVLFCFDLSLALKEV